MSEKVKHHRIYDSTTKVIYDEYKKNRPTEHWNNLINNLDQKIISITDDLMPTGEDMKKFDQAFDRVKAIISRAVKKVVNVDFEVLMYGSTVNGLACRGN